MTLSRRRTTPWEHTISVELREWEFGPASV